MRRLASYARVVCLAALALSVVYFLAMRQLWIRPRPNALAAIVVALCGWLTVELAAAVYLGARRTLAPLKCAVRGSLALGSLLVLGGGLANWAYSLQGFVVLNEGEAAPFFHGAHLQAFTTGPLSNLQEMELVLHLDDVAIVPTDAGELGPVSRLRLERAGEPVHRFSLTPRRSVADGTLRFHHGYFGYAPRILILQGDTTLFDRIVPFTTRLDDQTRVTFRGEFTVEQHGLRVVGQVSLDSLTAGLRGHPKLAVSVERDGVPLGSGLLRMGHFADLPGDHRVGFAGLKKWAEIDVVRKHYAEPMLAGATLFAVGVLLFAVSWALRLWRRR